jgi:hydrogenase nickel incorporation protein HypB
MRKIKVGSLAQSRNEDIAGGNRRLFEENDVFVMNLIGSPGAGKTSILEYTAKHCGGNFAVIVGDVKTALDADRILDCDIPAYPIETGGGCHLTAGHIRDVLPQLDLEGLDYLFIENVGNLVCPSTFDLGESMKIGVLSVPEGDEKVRKYPALFARTGVVFINKIDLLQSCPYDVETVREDCKKANSGVKVFEVSATRGDGLEDWIAFLDNREYGR